MSTQTISVTILGSGPVANLLAQRLQQKAGFSLLDSLPSGSPASPEHACVIILPTDAELADGSASQRITDLLRAGFNVVSTAPSAALATEALLAACREGKTTYHGSGGFQSSLAVRFNRAFASITRDIRAVQLIEELDHAEPELTRHETASADGVTANEPYYRAGLHTLAEAVLGDELADQAVKTTATDQQAEQANRWNTADSSTPSGQRQIQRTLGNQIAYDSVWRNRADSSVPLRYQLNTTSADAVGHVNIHFHAESAIQPTDHLTCLGLLDAIIPVVTSKPGILHHDLEINHVKPDDRLAR